MPTSLLIHRSLSGDGNGTGSQPKSDPLLSVKKRRADIAMELASKNAEFFHTKDMHNFAELRFHDHNEIWPIRSPGYERWVRFIYYRETDSAITQADFNTVIRQSEAQAMFDGGEKKVGLRVAGVEGAVYLDLCNNKWEQVRITPEGWEIITAAESPIKFRRNRGMAELPRPISGSRLNIIREVLNIDSDGAWVLMASWLLGAMKPEAPYPILILQGEQGTSKSTTARLLRSLIDPSEVPTRTLPGNERDLAISALASRILSYDNISGFKPAMSDAYCRIATGGGFGTRTLYTDKSEELFNSTRPLMFNGISDLAIRHDFADRSLVLTLPPIPDQKRLPEYEIAGKWARIQPRAIDVAIESDPVALATLELMQRRENEKIWSPEPPPNC